VYICLSVSIYVFVYANWYERDNFRMHSGLWLDSPGKGYYAWDDSDVSPRYRLNSKKVWRHLALQFGRFVHVTKWSIHIYI